MMAENISKAHSNNDTIKAGVVRCQIDVQL